MSCRRDETRTIHILIAVALGVLLVAVRLCGRRALSPPAPRNATSLNVTVSGSQKWVDTGMDVQAGDKLHITAKGTVNMGNNSGITADGAARGWVDTLRALMVPSAGRGALVGRVGNSDAATPFFVGADGTVQAPIAGRLYLGINQDSMQTPDGKYEVHIDRIADQRGDRQWRRRQPEQLRFQAAIRRTRRQAAVSGDRSGAGRQSGRPGQLRYRRNASSK